MAETHTGRLKALREIYTREFPDGYKDICPCVISCMGTRDKDTLNRVCSENYGKCLESMGVK